MPKLIRWEFMGSWLLFWIMCITGLGIPLALLYLINGTLRVEYEVEDPDRFIAEYRAGKFG